MAKELTTTGASALKPIPPEERNEAIDLMILGGVEEPAKAFRAGDALDAQMAKQDLILSALHQNNTAAVQWLTQAGAQIVALAGMLGEPDALTRFPENWKTIGMGETEAMANRPLILQINGIRLGIVSFGEQPMGEFSGRADAMSLMANDRVRMLINQCDHVIVLVRAGLDAGELPLPEWRARYHRFIDVGASIVLDTGRARGWEAYQNGLVFYGLGSPAGADALGLFLTLRRNGRLSYEARALQRVAGTLDFSMNEAFRASIDEQNKLFMQEQTYLRAAGEMCQRLYCAREAAQKRGVLGLFVPHADEELRLLSLLENESLRLMTLRALRLKNAAEQDKRENVKRA